MRFHFTNNVIGNRAGYQRKKRLTVFAFPFRCYTRLYGQIEHRSKLYDRSKYGMCHIVG